MNCGELFINGKSSGLMQNKGNRVFTLAGCVLNEGKVNINVIGTCPDGQKVKDECSVLIK